MHADERRSYPRYQRRDIHITLLDHLEQVMDDQPVLADISQGGAGLTTRAKILPGEGIKFHLHLPGGAIATGLGKVRWVQDETGPTFARQCGIEFLDFGWGGYGRLQEELGGESVAISESRIGVVDSLLMLACAIVGWLVFKTLIASPALAESAAPILLIGGSLLGLFVLSKR